MMKVILKQIKMQFICKIEKIMFKLDNFIF